MKERLSTLPNSLTAKYVAVFVLLVAVPAIGISWYLLDSSYNDNKRALIQLQQAEAKALIGRIDQTLLVLADRLRSMQGQGLTSDELESLLRPLLVSNLTPLTAMYVDGQGATAGVVGQTELGRLSRRELEQDALAKFVRNDQAGTYGEKRWTVYCECGWLEDAHTKELARSEHRWHVRQVKQLRDFADEVGGAP